MNHDMDEEDFACTLFLLAGILIMRKVYDEWLKVRAAEQGRFDREFAEITADLLRDTP